MFREALVLLISVSSGLLISLGVTSVLLVVSLVPRLAGRTGTANHIFLYENMVVLGTILGGILSIYWEYDAVAMLGLGMTENGHFFGNVLLCYGGVFSGMFIGCLALAIAEMIDSIPIFLKRVSWKYGITLMVISVAIGKILGSLIYFGRGF